MEVTGMTTNEFAEELVEQVQNSASVSDVMHLLDQWGKKDTFESAVRTLMQYLGANHHPRTSVIATCDRAEIVEGIECFTTKEYIVD